MKSIELRKKFVDFYISRKHKEIKAAPLLAENDPTLLFVNSGMFPLVPYLSGESHPAGKRLVNYQRSFRTDDIEEVGDHRHTTFFEMLGNWGLGDYFKEEQLNWWYEFLVEVLKLDPHKIYQSVYAGDKTAPRDDETIAILTKIYKKYGVKAGVGVATTTDGNKGPGVEVDFNEQRMFPYVDKNWWKRGDTVGELGGPDSETFYDTGLSHNPKFGKFCHVNCDCGRFIEIGNSVFMQYKKTTDGWEELSQKNVDFGGGLERLAMVSIGSSNVFKSDLFSGYIAFLEQKTNTKYDQASSSYEIIADHARAATFLIADGCAPSNKDQGYFVRRLIRRGLIHLKKLDIDFNAFAELAEMVIEKMSPVYPHLEKNRANITQNIADEVEKFSHTIKNGLKYFEKVKPVDGKLSNDDVFDLVTTHGFPLEIIREIAAEKGYKIDEDGFNEKLIAHRSLSKAGSEKKFKSGLADSSEMTVKLHTATHLLHQALRQVLGGHVEQKGSNITSDRLRFDFSHPRKMTPEEIKQVEDIVNAKIGEKLPVYCEETTPATAKEANAIGLFDSKYGDKVKVYSVGRPIGGDNAAAGADAESAFSREICSGPHVNNTEELGHFKIVKEEASSSGVRRIKAVLD